MPCHGPKRSPIRPAESARAALESRAACRPESEEGGAPTAACEPRQARRAGPPRDRRQEPTPQNRVSTVRRGEPRGLQQHSPTAERKEVRARSRENAEAHRASEDVAGLRRRGASATPNQWAEHRRAMHWSGSAPFTPVSGPRKSSGSSPSSTSCSLSYSACARTSLFARRFGRTASDTGARIPRTFT